MKQILILLCLASALIGMTPALAAPPRASEGMGPAVRQAPTQIRVDYTADKQTVKFFLSTLPAVMACGKISPLPVMGWVDDGAMNVETADYSIVQGSPDVPGSCGTGYKTARAEISVPTAMIREKEVKQMRFWYKGIMDSFYFNWRGPDTIEVSPPATSKFFVPGRNLSGRKSK